MIDKKEHKDCANNSRGARRIKLLIYSHSFFPAVGGVETYAQLLASCITDDESFDVRVITQTAAENEGAYSGASVIRRPTFARLVREIADADVVFSAGPALAPMLLALLCRKPFVVEHHGYQAVCPNGLLLNKVRGGVCAQSFRNGRLSECYQCVAVDRGAKHALLQIAGVFARRWLCKRTFINIAVSNHVKERHGLDRMTVIYHGIPSDPSVNRAVGRQAAEDGVVRFGYVGRLVEEKGLSLLVAATAMLKSEGIPLQVYFIGDGPLRATLAAQVRELGIDGLVTFSGFLRGDALAHAASSLDVVVMPSAWEETAGLSAMEQMMRGRAVLAADIGGLGEIVGRGGVKFRPFDRESLAEGMKALTDVDFRIGIGIAGRARAHELFNLARMIGDHKALFSAAFMCRGNRPS